MQPALLQRLASGACVANVLLLSSLQFFLTPRTAAPMGLFLLFVGIWIFGAVMLFVAPRFGAAGTAVWGLLAATAALRTHRSLDVENAAIILFSLAGAALAICYLVRVMLRRG